MKFTSRAALYNFFFFLPPREGRVLLYEKIQLYSFYVFSLIILVLFPREVIKLHKDGFWITAAILESMILLSAISLVLFWKTRDLKYSQRILATLLFCTMLVSVWTGGGYYGLSILYFLASFSILFLILDYKTGVIFPVLFLILTILRFKFGEFTVNSIYYNEEVRNRFIVVLVLASIYGVIGSLAISLLVKTLSKLAYSDPVTGLPNAAHFQESFERLVLQERRHGRSLTLVGIKVYQLQRINANLGSDIGNTILEELGKRFRKENYLLTARWSMSLFLFVIPTSDIVSMKRCLEDFLGILEKPYRLAEHNRSLQFTTALSRHPEDGDFPQDIFKNVLTLIEGRSLVPGDIAFFNEDKLRSEQNRFSLGEAINHSDLEQDFRLVYQPKVSFIDNNSVGAEVLLRWNSENLGSVSPEVFIPIAEENGAIRVITRWVIEKAFKDISSMDFSSMKRSRELLFAINLSVLDLKDKTLVPFVSRMLKLYDICPEMIEFEVTEGIQIDQDPSIQNTLRILSEMGFPLAIDDFGTGYSSLSYLHQLRVNSLKIDKSFVQLIHSESIKDSYPVIDAIISLGQSMNLEITAEGVETREQFEYLKRKGCNQAQGWLFSKAVSWPNLIKYLENDGVSP